MPKRTRSVTLGQANSKYQETNYPQASARYDRTDLMFLSDKKIDVDQRLMLCHAWLLMNGFVYHAPTDIEQLDSYQASCNEYMLYAQLDARRALILITVIDLMRLVTFHQAVKLPSSQGQIDIKNQNPAIKVETVFRHMTNKGHSVKSFKPRKQADTTERLQLKYLIFYSEDSRVKKNRMPNAAYYPGWQSEESKRKLTHELEHSSSNPTSKSDDSNSISPANLPIEDDLLFSPNELFGHDDSLDDAPAHPVCSATRLDI